MPPPAPVQQERRREEINPAEDLEYNIQAAASGVGLGMVDLSAVRGDDDAEEDSPPGR